MDDMMILDAVERYIRGEMNPDERLHFENLRKSNSEIDQLVVEHTLFLQQMNRFGESKKIRTTLHDTHTRLAEQGKIKATGLKGKAKVVYLWNRYKRVTAIAAVIAGVTTITITALVNTFAPKAEDSKVKELVKEVDRLKIGQTILDNKIDKVDKDKKETKIPINMPVRFNGTGFLIDGKGYLITNAHVVKNSKNIYIQNNKGDQYHVEVVQSDLARDIAILKIVDNDFKTITTLPYNIRKANTDLAEPIFTLGFPRNEIVYGEGYMSAKTGLNGDTLSCQISVAANPGNSGGPVFNNDGEVIGILSTKDVSAEGVAFAIKSKYIFDAIDRLKKDTTYQSVKLPVKATLQGLEKTQQVNKIQDYVFMVKGD